ncbi:hypothetical protein [Roseibacillus ishigakijimensis]|uniref:Uncharacterized protein n=1 Tax=Roseibacillus ishigakijimensis TaxID=454146 RepID=A0A934RLF5_9BACT|nr:hypothetical protein [Roseibacillus ishigakijimensis]MBK1833003.1 hypothetical protein [Roseibacillus ishigakijimensis]
MAHTAFPHLEADLAQTVREAALDGESFRTPLRLCELSRCRAMCCHDGVFVGPEEQTVLTGEFPGEHFEQRGRRLKTRTVAAGEEELGVGYPGHFPRTRCVFLDEKHHCRLQSRAMAEGRHPWFWKPFPCWLHPLGFRRQPGSGRPLLSLPTAQDDPAAGEGYPGFASCTPCGKAEATGQPAWQTLRAELAFLSEISGRDVLAALAE